MRDMRDVVIQIRDYADRKSRGMDRYPIVRQCQMIEEWAVDIGQLSAEVEHLHAEITHLFYEIGLLQTQKFKWDKYLAAVKSLGKAPESSPYDWTRDEEDDEI